MRWFALGVVLFGVAGCLAVDSPNGSLFCSDVPGRACPEGFYCLSPDNKCWRIGEFPGDMADPIHFVTGGGDDMSVPFEPDDLSASDDLSPPNDLTDTD